MSRVTVARLTSTLYLLRLEDTGTLFFEGLWRIPEGVTYNSYVAVLPETVVVLDGWKIGYGELFLETLRSIVDPRDVKLVVSHHLEPDHSGSLRELLNEAREAVILAHPIARSLLQSYYGLGSRLRSVGDGDAVDLGGGYVLRFAHTPWLHWPDTIVSYLEQEKTLFTCDIFGSYGIPRTVFYEDMPEEDRKLFNRYMRKYAANVLGHYADWIQKGVSKIERLAREARIIAPGHGPLFRDAEHPLSLYTTLSSGKPVRGKTLVFYTSMYGFAEKLAERIARRLRDAGFSVSVYGFSDIGRSDESEVVNEAFDSEYIFIVTSTYENKPFPLAEYLASLIASKVPPSGRKVVVVSVYGWTPGAGKKIAEIFEKRGFLVEDIVETRGIAEDSEKRALKRVLQLEEGPSEA